MSQLPQMAKVISTELLENQDARWMNLVQIQYLDPLGHPRTWEAMRRIGRPLGSAVDAVQIVAILEPSPSTSPSTSPSPFTSPSTSTSSPSTSTPLPPSSGKGPQLLLEKQFRAPAGRLVVELPAGLVDPGETAEQAALRELREETGYCGEVLADRGGGRPVLYSSPASSCSRTFLIHLKIDPEREENKNPKQNLEDGEFIECFWVPLDDLYAECRRLEAQGFAIDGKVGVLAEGLEMAKMWKTS